jgi:hypothetical protein
MAEFFSEKYQYLWMVLLAAMLFLPVRQMIWVLMVRRAQKKQGQDIDTTEQERLKNRAAVTAALLCFVFSAFYVLNLFQGRP